MFELAELERRLVNLLLLGKIADLNAPQARARVRSGDILTGWLPWLTGRAGVDRSWWAPEINEQVMVLSPSGDITQGVILPALFQDQFGPPGTINDVHRVEYGDGAIFEYNRGAHSLTIKLPEDGRVELKAPQNIFIDAAGGLQIKATAGISILGDVTVAGDVIANGISLTEHVHGGVDSGGSNTAPPA